MLAFFCTLIHKNVIKDIGFLDERLADGLVADDLYCINAKKRGWRIVCCYDAYCAHLHSETFRRLKLDRRGMHKQAMKTFKKIQK